MKVKLFPDRYQDKKVTQLRPGDILEARPSSRATAPFLGKKSSDYPSYAFSYVVGTSLDDRISCVGNLVVNELWHQAGQHALGAPQLRLCDVEDYKRLRADTTYGVVGQVSISRDNYSLQQRRFLQFLSEDSILLNRDEVSHLNVLLKKMAAKR